MYMYISVIFWGWLVNDLYPCTHSMQCTVVSCAGCELHTGGWAKIGQVSDSVLVNILAVYSFCLLVPPHNKLYSPRAHSRDCLLGIIMPHCMAACIYRDPFTIVTCILYEPLTKPARALHEVLTLSGGVFMQLYIITNYNFSFLLLTQTH